MTRELDGTRLVTPAMIAVVVILATVPFWIQAIGLYQYLAVEILIWAIYAFAFNLLLGTGGLPSFGHGAFFGIGAYACGLAQMHLGAGLWLSLIAALLAATLAGAFVSAFVARRRGIYFALMTIAFGQIFWFIAMKARDITGGEDGLLPIARPPVGIGGTGIDITGNVAFYYFVLVIFALVLVLFWRLTHSPFGRVLAAIRQSETRAGHLGYSVLAFKMAAFTLSAAISGMAGGLFAMAQASAFPDVMSLHFSGYIVMMVLVGGGFASFWGPLVGVLVFFVARDVLGAFTSTWMLWFGLLFVTVILFKPEGIAGLAQDVAKRLRKGDRENERPVAATAVDAGS
ncbi:branched-chain amino acid ABC transporter permease [Marinivivus vitaminiproducens]|uniref:branched-chain amino acid ABC transporter permease n=1 Tax=Marinivivus vitaminiproducens TaxID=3035935 RepID=UPI0027AB133A|nr:branched-chain amino acid ABC transporter permease [Geminicoccaceae bacterium SCSIO 64248]